MRFEDWLEEDEPMFETWGPNVRVVKRENGTILLYDVLVNECWEQDEL